MNGVEQPFMFRTRKQIRRALLAIAGCILVLASLGIILWFSGVATDGEGPYRYVRTVAGMEGLMGEPFGVAVTGGAIFVSDGEQGKIWRIESGQPVSFAEGLDTPSAIAVDKAGNLIVADSGSHTIKLVNSVGQISLLAGVEGRSGFADGDAATALFNGPIGVAVAADGRILVADTYNDRIRVIENGRVITLAGYDRGYIDGDGVEAKFDTPCGITAWQDKILVADTANRRLRVVEPDGRVWTLAGDGDGGLKDGLLSASSFVQPTAIAVDKRGSVFVADGNSIRQIGGGTMPIVQTISDHRRGLRDGQSLRARFNRPSGLAFDDTGNLIVADSENRLIRKFSSKSVGHDITAAEVEFLREKPLEFKALQLPRWPYDPPLAKRDIAGTLGEIRGEMRADGEDARFHNGLDIAGAYGETARFIRDEKVLRPTAAENFGTSRELIRMPTLGYIHIRLGRDQASRTFDDARYQFERDTAGILIGVRVPRGSAFKAGEPVGTLNSMNHIHLIAGRTGYEMNALDALILPDLTDSRSPVIEKIALFDQNWKEIETAANEKRIRLTGKTRITVRAYDQADGNSERRRLGVYRLGYQILKPGTIPEPNWTIRFDRMPSPEAVNFVYANGSKSGATGETVFDYVVTNFVDGDDFREDFIDTASLANGIYTLRVFAADYFGNISIKDMTIEVLK